MWLWLLCVAVGDCDVACFHPLTGYRVEGERKIVFGEPASGCLGSVQLPCGQCIGCRLERSRQWAMRCMHESQCYDDSSFVTLTYDNDHCPDGLVYRDFQLFMKRVRKRFGPTRFFMCGEYGERFARPHFHACLFGLSFPDKKRLCTLPSGSVVGSSDLLSGLWGKGFCSVGDVTFESAAYVARYVLKKVGSDVERLGIVDYSTGAICVRRAEFCQASRRPGLGYPWLVKFHGDVFPRDEVVIRGMKMKPPRYYDGKAEDFLSAPELLELEGERLAKFASAELDSSPDRLVVREFVTNARLAFKKRGLV